MGFLLPLLPLPWICSVINKCWFHCACILKFMVHFTKVMVFGQFHYFLNKCILLSTCTYCISPCLFVECLCMGSNKDYFELNWTLHGKRTVFFSTSWLEQDQGGTDHANWVPYHCLSAKNTFSSDLISLQTSRHILQTDFQSSSLTMHVETQAQELEPQNNCHVLLAD